MTACAPEAESVPPFEQARAGSDGPAETPARLVRDPAAGPAAAAAGGETLEQLEIRVAKLRDEIARAALRRDVLLGRVARLETDRPAGFPGSLRARWRLRGARADLQRTVVKLQQRQARLLLLEARRETVAGEDAEREWAQLEERLQRAAAAWEAGGADPAQADTALLLALESSAPTGPGASVPQYRELVARLARLNSRLGVTPSAEPPRPSSSPAGGARDRASDFLGVDERGARAVPDDGDREAWLSLRRALADEIVAVASEVTRRARGSP